MSPERDESHERTMLSDQQIIDADLPDWRKLDQGLHARFVTDGFAAGVRFLAAVGAAGRYDRSSCSGPDG